MSNHNLPTFYRDQSQHNCVFCSPSQELVLESTEHFRLILDPFALVPGHLLITSQGHYGCLGEVPQGLQEECSSLREAAIELLKGAFEAPVMRYEHGRAGHCMTHAPSSRSCHHYHEHLIPCDLSLHEELEKRFKWIPVVEDAEICSLFARYEEYLFVAEANSDKRFYIANSDDVESHLLRTMAARALNHPQRHDWEQYDSCSLMLEGKQVLELALRQERAG